MKIHLFLSLIILICFLTYASAQISDTAFTSDQRQFDEKTIIVEKNSKDTLDYVFIVVQITGILGTFIALIITIKKNLQDNKHSKKVLEQTNQQIEALIKSNELREDHYRLLHQPIFIFKKPLTKYPNKIIQNDGTFNKILNCDFENIGEKATMVKWRCEDKEEYILDNKINMNLQDSYPVINKNDKFSITINFPKKTDFFLKFKLMYSDISDFIYYQTFTIYDNGKCDISPPVLIK